MKISPLYKYLGKKKGLLISYFIVNPINSVLEILLAYASGAAIELAVGGNLEQIPSYITAFIVYALLWFTFSILHGEIRNRILENSLGSLKNDLMHSLINTSPDNFHKENSGIYLAHFSSDMEILRGSFFFMILSLYGQIIQFAVALFALFFVDSIMGAFVIIMALAQLIIPVFAKKPISRCGTENAKKQQQYTRSCKEVLESYQTAQLFGVKKEMNNFHKKTNEEAEVARRHSKIVNMFVNEISFSMGTIMYLGIFIIGAVLVLKGHLAVGAIVAASQLMVHVASPLTSISQNFAELNSASEVADNIKKLIDLPSMSIKGVEKHDFKKAIEVNNVRFAYNDKEILKGVSCTFEKGKKYLIKGPSGSGKSTLLALLSGQYAPNFGSIKIDGTTLGDLSEKSLNDIMVLNPQEPYLFDWSIADNIRFFHDASDEEIMDLIKKSGLKERIDRLSEGIYADFGENGSEFSGGEKQRIGIIRAILRKTPIILMDESTSHLDSESVKMAEKMLFDLDGATVIIVSHNFSEELEKYVDEVISMKDGKISQGASHIIY